MMHNACYSLTVSVVGALGGITVDGKYVAYSHAGSG